MFYFNFCWDFKCASEMYMQFQHFTEIVHLSMFVESVVKGKHRRGESSRRFLYTYLYIYI